MVISSGGFHLGPLEPWGLEQGVLGSVILGIPGGRASGIQSVSATEAPFP